MAIYRNVTVMKRKVVSLLGAFAILALAVPAVVSAQTELAERDEGSSSPIEGSWIFEIDRINQGITFTALMSFTAGGVALATGSIDRLPPPPISPIYGSWKRTGPNRFDVTIYFFVFDPLGNAAAMIKTNENLHLNNRGELVGPGFGFSCDLKGENCVSVPAVSIQIKGKRIVPESIRK
jgi:hypothetical protein